MTDRFKRLSHKLFGSYTIAGLAGEPHDKVNCSETVFAFFHFLPDKTILCVKNSFVYYKGNSATPCGSQTDYLIENSDFGSFKNPLNITETASLLLDSKTELFSLIRSQCRQDNSDFPSCFSDSIEKIVSDIKSGKIQQVYLELLPEEYNV